MIASNACGYGWVSVCLLALSACATASADPAVVEVGHDHAVVNSPSSCLLYGPTVDLGFHAGECGQVRMGDHLVRLSQLSADTEYFVRAGVSGGAQEGPVRFRTLPAFACGDGRCDRERGENELLCPADCRIDRCDNTFGAYGFSVAKDYDIPEAAHRAGVRFSVGYTYPLQQTEVAGADPLHVLHWDGEGKRIALMKQPGRAPLDSRPLLHPARFSLGGKPYRCDSSAWWDAGGGYRFGGLGGCEFPEGAVPVSAPVVPDKQYAFAAMVQLNSKFTNRFQLREPLTMPLAVPGRDEVKVCSVQRKLRADDLGNCQRLAHSPIGKFPAVFSVEWEEVSCEAFDPVDSKFVGCTRGFGHTLATIHPARTFLLDHTGLREYLASIRDKPKLGYYVQDDPIDDSRSPGQPKSNYLPLLQKMYQIIKQEDPIHPVFAGFPTLGLYMYPWKETIPSNIGPGAFDAAVLYVYPGMRNLQDPSIRKDTGKEYGDEGFDALVDPKKTTKTVVGRYMQVFDRRLGHRPPFLGVFRAFRMAPQWPENPTREEVRQQIDDFLDFGASAIAAYTLHSENPLNITPTSPVGQQYGKAGTVAGSSSQDGMAVGSGLLDLLEYGAHYATSRLCKDGGMNPPLVEWVTNGTAIRYSVSGSHARYDCAVSLDGDEFRVDRGIADSQPTQVALPRAPKDSVGVRCWNGSLQNSAILRPGAAR